MKSIILTLLFLAGCNSSQPSFSPIAGVTRNQDRISHVEVIVENLGASPLTAALNEESTLLISKDGRYAFPREVSRNLSFEVKVTFNPPDRNCFVTTPLVTATLPKHTVRILCTDTSKNFIGGLVQGHKGPLQVMKGSEVITLTTSEDSYFFKTPVASSELLTMVSPPDQECYFEANHLTTYSAPASPRTNIYCLPKLGSTYTFTVNISGLSGSLDLYGMRPGLGTHVSQVFSGSNTFMVSNAYANRRHVIEIVDAPDNQRCYFNNSGTHLYSEKIPLAMDHSIFITCVPRGNCEHAGLELPSVDGTISDVTCLNDSIFYGGSFSKVGKQLGLVNVYLDASGTGGNVLNRRVFDRIHGRIFSIIPDGRQGFFVGGDFTKVGDQRIRNLVRLDKDFLIDEDFKWEFDGIVTNLKLKDNELYVVGNYNQVLNGTRSYERAGFTKIKLGAGDPVLSTFKLAPGLKVNNKASSMDVIDSSLYLHGGFRYKNADRNLSVSINRFSGALSLKETFQPDFRNTLYWKEPLTGQVWMIHKKLGIVNPRTLAPHLRDVAHLAVPLEHHYTIDSMDRLHSSDSSSLKLTNLLDLYNGSSAAPASPYPVTVANVANGFTVDNFTCFLAFDSTIPISISPASTRDGLACFDNSQNLLAANSELNLRPTAALSVVSGGLNQIILGAQHWVSIPSHSMARIPLADPSNAFTPLTITSGVVNSLGTDGSYIYYGGSFQTGDSNIQYLARSDFFTVDANWYPTAPFTQEVTALSVTPTTLFASTRDPARTFFGLDVSLSPDNLQVDPAIDSPVDALASVNESVATLQNGEISFRELSGLSSSIILNKITDQTLVNSNSSQFITLNPNQLIYRLPSGSTDYSLNLMPFNRSTTKLFSTENHNCLYDGQSLIRCYDSAGNLGVSGSLWSGRISFGKGVGNFVFFSNVRASPDVIVP